MKARQRVLEALGAGAAQLGTAFLACPEVSISPAYRSVYGARGAKATQLQMGEFLPMWAGQGVGLARAEPAADLVARLVRETQAVADDRDDTP